VIGEAMSPSNPDERGERWTPPRRCDRDGNRNAFLFGGQGSMMGELRDSTCRGRERKQDQVRCIFTAKAPLS